MTAPRARGFAIAGVVLLVVLVGALSPWSPLSPWADGETADDPSSSVGPTFRVELGTPTEQLSGLDWPVDADGQPRLGTAVEQPREVEVLAGDRVVLTTPSRTTVLTQRNGQVTTVEMLPQETSSDVATAVDAVRSLLGRHGLLDDDARAELDAIVADPPDPDPMLGDTPSFRAADDDVDVFVDFRPTDDGAWFAAVQVAGPLD